MAHERYLHSSRCYLKLDIPRALLNSILYISTVKRILRAGIIGGMKNLYETYRRAAANWMEVEEGKIAMGANTENVDNYMRWIEELNVWRSKYLIWKKQNYKY